jgi:hypothetical protein
MPPENSGYAYAAYAAAITVYAVYVISVWWRGQILAARIRAATAADRSGPSER